MLYTKFTLMRTGLLTGVCMLLSIAVFSQDWLTDLNEAEAIAAKDGKEILLVFQGSDWCAPCMKLEKEIWSTDAFKDYAKEHYVMLKADFPRSKKNALSREQQDKNNKLFEKYNSPGYFPYVVILDSNGVVHGTTGYQKMSPQDYIAHLDAIKS